MSVEILSEWFGLAQQGLFEAVVQPLLFALGGGSLLEDAFAATGWLLAGLIELGVMLAVIAPLQHWRPAQVIRDRHAVRIDVIYTLIQRLGLFRVAMFFAFEPIWNDLWGWLAVHNLSGFQLDALIAPLWPGVTDSALASFLVYLLAFDFLLYWIHRGQHQFEWWWALHALHHSQREMTMWTDNRNHLLDSAIVDILLVQAGHLIGVPPGQFVAVVAVSQLVENLSHANLRLSFGLLGERLLVSPRFHRLHHAIGIGHESQGKGTLGGHNFSILFPVWDLLFGTANFADRYEATGIRDQLPEEGARNYGEGFWEQQWLGLCRLVGRA
jgi:sterol desaturase/sphingolipid hydroxylase (fatty acid hydroxylase superfamily)